MNRENPERVSMSVAMIRAGLRRRQVDPPDIRARAYAGADEEELGNEGRAKSVHALAHVSERYTLLVDHVLPAVGYRQWVLSFPGPMAFGIR